MQSKTKQKILSLVMAMLMLCSVIAIQVSASEVPQVTSPSDWAVSAINEAITYGIYPKEIEGKSMQEPITRAEFAAISVTLYEKIADKVIPNPTAPNPFTDTQDANILKAFSIGIINGTTKTEFEPNALLDREQAVTIFTRMFKSITMEGWTIDKDSDANFALGYLTSSKFVDESKLSDWAHDAVYFMASKGIVNGTDGNSFNPTGNMSREEAIIVSGRMYKTVKLNEDLSPVKVLTGSNNPSERLTRVMAEKLSPEQTTLHMVIKAVLDDTGVASEITIAIKDEAIYINCIYGGVKTSIIFKDGIASCIVPSEKMVMSINANDFMGMMNMDFSALTNGMTISGDDTTTLLYNSGSEKINDIDYDYDEIIENNEAVRIYYEAKTDNIKYIKASGQLLEIVALDNKVEDSWFVIPKDYRVVTPDLSSFMPGTPGKEPGKEPSFNIG